MSPRPIECYVSPTKVFTIPIEVFTMVRNTQAPLEKLCSLVATRSGELGSVSQGVHCWGCAATLP
jgi:hypothetical protein